GWHYTFQAADDIRADSAVQQGAVHEDETPRGPFLGNGLVSGGYDLHLFEDIFSGIQCNDNPLPAAYFLFRGLVANERINKYIIRPCGDAVIAYLVRHSV